MLKRIGKKPWELHVNATQTRADVRPRMLAPSQLAASMSTRVVPAWT